MTNTDSSDDHQQELHDMQEKLDEALQLIRKAARLQADPVAIERGMLTPVEQLQYQQALEASLAPLILALQHSYRLHVRTYKALKGKPPAESA